MEAYFERTLIELRMAARRSGCDPSTAEDLAQSAICGFIRWLADQPRQIESPESFGPFLYTRLAWVRNTQRLRMREIPASQFASGENREQGFDFDAIPHAANEAASMLRIILEPRFDTFYKQLTEIHRPRVVNALRDFCAAQTPDNIVGQFHHARLMVFTRMDDEARDPEDVQELARVLDLKLNATQAALCRLKGPWLQVEQSLFRRSPSEGNEHEVNPIEHLY